MVESPLWMAANERYDESEEALRKIAKWNKVSVGEIQLARSGSEKQTALLTNTMTDDQNNEQPDAEKVAHAQSANAVRFTDLVRDRVMLKVTLISMLLW